MPTDSSGRELSINLRGGVGAINALTGSGYASQALPQGAFADSNVLGDAVGTVPVTSIPKASPAWWLIAFVVILVLLHLFGRHDKLDNISDKYVGVNVSNFIHIGLQAFVFFLVFKLSVLKFSPGSTLSNVVNFA